MALQLCVFLTKAPVNQSYEVQSFCCWPIITVSACVRVFASYYKERGKCPAVNWYPTPTCTQSHLDEAKLSLWCWLRGGGSSFQLSYVSGEECTLLACVFVPLLVRILCIYRVVFSFFPYTSSFSLRSTADKNWCGQISGGGFSPPSPPPLQQ